MFAATRSSLDGTLRGRVSSAQSFAAQNRMKTQSHVPDALATKETRFSTISSFVNGDLSIVLLAIVIEASSIK